jgi:RNA polymerase sigma-70 factor (ECF subfamily)
MVSGDCAESDRLGPPVSCDPSPEHRLLAQERRAHVATAVRQLPDRQRAVVVLSQFEGYSTREVAAIIGVTEATVRVHLFRAVRSLRRLLSGERWLFSPAPARREAS